MPLVSSDLQPGAGILPEGKPLLGAVGHHPPHILLRVVPPLLQPEDGGHVDVASCMVGERIVGVKNNGITPRLLPPPGTAFINFVIGQCVCFVIYLLGGIFKTMVCACPLALFPGSLPV